MLPPDYRPSDDEEFMNPLQIEYFRQKAVALARRAARRFDGHIAPSAGRKSVEAGSDRSRLARNRAGDRVAHARPRAQADLENRCRPAAIDTGTYGFCEETDQPIGIRRLEARPIATLTIEAQERHERMERTYRDE